MNSRAALLIMALALPSGASASVVWRGDFETGDRAQWSHTQMVSADRLAVQTALVAEGDYALRATVRQGDDPIDSSGNRNELVRMTREEEGDEYFYRWYTYFPADFPAPDTWQLFVQWHHSGSGGSPPVEFVVRDERIELSFQGGESVPWSMPLVRGRWLEFIFHVGWSSSASRGFVELYVDGELVLPRTAAATLFSGQYNYLKMGLYRNESISPVGVVYHDGMVQATTLADVWPQPAPVADAGTPSPEPAPAADAGGTDAGSAPSQPATTPDASTGGTDEGTTQGILGTPAGLEQEEAAAPVQGCSTGTGFTGLLGLLALAGMLRRHRR